MIFQKAGSFSVVFFLIGVMKAVKLYRKKISWTKEV